MKKFIYLMKVIGILLEKTNKVSIMEVLSRVNKMGELVCSIEDVSTVLDGLVDAGFLEVSKGNLENIDVLYKVVGKSKVIHP